MRHVDLIVLHCSATADGKSVSVPTIREWHHARGFTNIGYHYVIDVGGEICKGRSEGEIGAHAKGFNAHSIGVCLVGGITGHGRYTKAQWESLKDIIGKLREVHPITAIVGHRDLSPDIDGDGIVEPNEWIKLCPSFDVAEWLCRGMVPTPDHVL